MRDCRWRLLRYPWAFGGCYEICGPRPSRAYYLDISLWQTLRDMAKRHLKLRELIEG